MRTPLVLALLLSWPALAAEPAAPRSPSTMILWGGGKTRDEAEASAADFRQRASLWDDLVELAKDYPRIMESASVPGLKPGFQVVVLGVCEAKEGEEFATVFDTFEPRTYTRPVEWKEPGALPCPRFVDVWQLEGTARAKGKPGELLGAVFEAFESGGEMEAYWWKLILHAVGKDGALVASERVVSEGNYSTVRALRTVGAELELEEEVADPVCHGHSTEYVVHRRIRRFAVKEGQIVQREVSRKRIKSGECTPIPDYSAPPSER